jgi:spore germination protein YaaH
MFRKIYIIILLIFIVIPITSFAATKNTKTISSKTSKTTKKSTTTKKPSPKKVIPPDTMEQLVYYMPGPNAFTMFKIHGSKTDIVSPQVYQVDSNGNLTGKTSDELRAEVTNKKVKLIPLVINKDFNRDVMKNILASTSVQDTIITNLINEAQKNGYAGWQFNFEAIEAEYRDLYSMFVERAAEKFKAKQLLFSVAVIPRTSEAPIDLPKGSWQYYAGAYDFIRIGRAADFVTLMAYDQPTSTGPVADINWLKDISTYALANIPKEKLSIGIPVYGWIWDTQTGKKIRSTTYDKVIDLVVNKEYTKRGFDKKLGVGWITYTDPKTKQKLKLWYEDVNSFNIKYDYIRTLKVRGVSIWAIGQEDERIWSQW